MRAVAILALAMTVLGIETAPVFGADIHAVVVGVDEYDAQRDLLGAVNDAKDVASALSRFGASTKVLLDREATRSSVEAAWLEAVKRARAGDTLVFYFAGHGAQEQDANQDEAAINPNDVLDEALLLSAHRGDTLNGARERLLDDELYGWFGSAIEAGMRVLFVADSCYSGGLSRTAISTRKSDPYDIPEELTLRQGSITPSLEANFSPGSFLFISGSRESELVTEIIHEEAYRGAMSVAFAKALNPETSADANSDGILTRDELSEFMPALSYQLSNQHLPDFKPFGGVDFAILRRGSAVQEPNLSLSPIPSFSGWQPLETIPGGLAWNTSTGDVRDGEGNIVAFGLREAELTHLGDKFFALEAVRSAAMRDPMKLKIKANGQESNSVKTEGEIVEFEAIDIPFPWLTVFNLANDGTMQLLVPHPAFPAEEGPHQKGTDISMGSSRVAEPFGADHLIAISSSEPPRELWKALTATSDPRALQTELRRLAEGGKVAAGIAKVFSRAGN